MDLFLTGGTGYLGGRIARRLVDKGHRIRLLYRDPAGLPRPDPRILPVRGDLSRSADLRDAIAGVDAVIHTAAMVRSVVPDPAVMERVNVEAVGILIDLVRDLGVPRMLYTSSFMALGPSSGATSTTEADDPTREDFHNQYERTKYLGDQLARRRQAEGAPIITLYPTVIYGPGALTGGNLVGKIVRDFIRRRVPGRIGRGDAQWNYGYVEDVVEGHVLALERAATGSRYILGGENVTMDGFLELLSRVSGVPAPSLRIPGGVAAGLALAMEGWARLSSQDADLTREVLRIYQKDWAYSVDAARTDLGYSPRSLESGLTATVEWVRESLARSS